MGVQGIFKANLLFDPISSRPPIQFTERGEMPRVPITYWTLGEKDSRPHGSRHGRWGALPTELVEATGNEEMEKPWSSEKQGHRWWQMRVVGSALGTGLCSQGT